jgi:NAD(P)-dependent dehydrogenase (short-subunit alcohol dehydrogenase family)
LDFSGKAVIVTGGTRGIGRVIAQSFLTAGADVLICARGKPDSVPETNGRSAIFVATDLRAADQARAVVDAAVAEFGRLDVVVNNAGGSPGADAATVSPRFVEKVIALNLLAPFYVAQPANAVMQEQADGGVIINIGSVAAHQPEPGTAAYAAAKAGLLQLTRALALEWAPKVRVNHISTGLVLHERSAEFYGPAVARVIPMGRLAEPSDVAAACLFLASPAAGYITGADLPVHGGGEIPSRYLAHGLTTRPHGRVRRGRSTCRPRVSARHRRPPPAESR